MKVPHALEDALCLLRVVALPGIAIVLGSTGCTKPSAATPPPPIVVVAEVVATNVPMQTEFIGQVDSPQNVEIRARVEAFVKEVCYTEGAVVEQGTLLFKLDEKPLLQRLDAANAGLAEAKASLNKCQKDVARLKPLAEKHAISQADLDNAEASVEVAQANVLSAQARVESAELDVSYCQVRTPITGLIGAKQVSVGDLVGKGQPTLLATVSTQDPMWFYCNVSEVAYLRAEAEVQRTGRRVEDVPLRLILANGREHPEKGQFVFIDRALDVKTGTIRVRAKFPNSSKVLRPGLFGRIRADLGTRANSILVPERAVQELQGRSFVWVIGADKKATQRPIQIGPQHGDKLLVLEGLKPGDRFVVEGLQKVREGAEVQPMTAIQLAQLAAQGSATQPAKE